MSVVIYGAAGHGREVCWAARARVRATPAFGPLAGFVDDDPGLAGSTVADLPVLGDPGTVAERGFAYLLGAGYPEVKARMVERVGASAHWPLLVHPSTAIGARVTLGKGCLVQAGSALSCDIEVGPFATLNLGCTISHDGRVGRLATVSPGAHVGGNVVIEEGGFVGIGASVVQGVVIGAWSVVGAGATVVADVPPNSVVVGTPARVIETREPGWQNG